MSGYHLVARCSMLNHAANRRLVFRSDLILPLSKHTFDCCSCREAKVNHYSLIAFDRNQYSVPVTYPGNILTVKGYMGEVRIYDKQTLVAVHALL
ncbi:Mu transposase domain-containing protein [Sporomusa sp.]|uniref:Mu transposase domain-containing protein n=1 Tax=Sporomusa sp. TaxID=2078658 RepID=UPI0039C984F2